MNSGSESIRFHDIAAATRRLYDVVQALQLKAEFLRPAALDGQEWYELLRQKLVPQLGEDPWLVAARRWWHEYWQECYVQSSGRHLRQCDQPAGIRYEASCVSGSDGLFGSA